MEAHFRTLESGRRTYVLCDEGLDLTLERDEGIVFAQHPTLPVSGYGSNVIEALEAFAECFDVQYRNLVERPLTDLTPYGSEVRGQLEALVCAVC